MSEPELSRVFTPRERITRSFICIGVVAWGVLIGAKLFDLRVLVGAWSSSPPESLSLLPYGPHYPVDTGEFFIPSSAALLVASFGALIGGWKTPSKFRLLLFVSAVMIFAVLMITVLAFWPRNAALWAVAQGSPKAIKDTEAIVAMVREWIRLDWLRIAMASVGYGALLRAISMPFPAAIERAPATLLLKVLYGLGVAAVVAFIIYFLRGL